MMASPPAAAPAGQNPAIAARRHLEMIALGNLM
jgi:hypothetical protein